MRAEQNAKRREWNPRDIFCGAHLYSGMYRLNIILGMFVDAAYGENPLNRSWSELWQSFEKGHWRLPER